MNYKVKIGEICYLFCDECDYRIKFRATATEQFHLEKMKVTGWLNVETRSHDCNGYNDFLRYAKVVKRL